MVLNILRKTIPEKNIKIHSPYILYVNLQVSAMKPIMAGAINIEHNPIVTKFPTVVDIFSFD